MLDKIGFGCCIAGAVLAVASFIWPGKHLLAWGIGLFVLGWLLQRLARRGDDVAEALGEAAADVLDLGD
jgi:hypothetical protein